MWQLDELDEWRALAYDNSKTYKDKAKIYPGRHIKRNKVLREGEEVLLFNSRLQFFPSKLKSRWSEPFKVTKVFPYGTLEILHSEKITFKENGQQVKVHLGGPMDRNKEVIYLQEVDDE